MSLSLFQRLGGTPPVASRLRQRLQLLVASAALAAAFSAALFLAHLHQSAVDEARIRTSDAARLLEEHIVRTLRTTDFIVGRAAALARPHPMAELANSERSWQELMALSQGLPEPGTLWIADADGEVRLGTIRFPAMPANIADRLYFSAQRDGHRDLFIGPLVREKNRDNQAFHVSRRIDGPNGSFLGVAAAGLDASTFTDFHRTLSLGQSPAITIFDMEGRVILRQPEAERWTRNTLGAGKLLTALQRGQSTGTFIGVSPLDGVERLIAYRVVSEFGLVVVAGIAMDDVLSSWRQSVWVTGTFLAVVTVMLGSLVAITFTSLSREEELVKGLEQTVRDRTEDARTQAEEARRANESKTRFLAAASHDLRQPLQAAGMFVEVLAVRSADTPNAPIVEKLRQSIDATQALLTTLLDVSTLEAGKIEPQVSTFPLMPLLANLFDQMEHETSGKGLDLTVVPTDARITSDPVLLERILRNLLINAARYTDKGGLLLGCRRRGDQLAICVVDTGKGIPEDKLNIIFDDFTRLGDKGSGISRGLGLGLGVVRRMTQLLGHRIEVRSVPDKGSCFAVVVPLAA